jgi:hypothetical protein
MTAIESRNESADALYSANGLAICAAAGADAPSVAAMKIATPHNRPRELFW